MAVIFVSRLPNPEISATTALRVVDGALVADSRFVLELPLPARRPIPARSRRARDLEVARSLEDDATLYDVVGNERVQHTRAG